MKTAYEQFLDNQNPNSKARFAEQQKKKFHPTTLMYKIHNESSKKLKANDNANHN